MWSKKNTLLVDDTETSVQNLARQLGVERRQNVRVFYPPQVTGPLPVVSHNGTQMRVQDISVGGCCILDAPEHLGAKIGNDITLDLRFRDGKTETVKSRIVSRVDFRRHIQFLDLPVHRVDELRDLMRPGICGLAIRRTLQASGEGLELEAQEIWSSLAGDALIIRMPQESEERSMAAEITISGVTYSVASGEWPKDKHKKDLSLSQLNSLILFISNINRPGPSVRHVLARLERFSEKGAS